MEHVYDLSDSYGRTIKLSSWWYVLICLAGVLVCIGSFFSDDTILLFVFGIILIVISVFMFFKSAPLADPMDYLDSHETELLKSLEKKSSR